MAQKYIIQIETNGKWESAYRGTDKAAAESTYHSSVAEFGSDAIRILRSDGTKEDGSIIWATAEAPIKTGPEPKPEPEPNSTTTERAHSMAETLQSTENAQSETEYTFSNIYKVKKPEDVGGFSTAVFRTLLFFCCLILPIIGLAVWFWKRKDPAPVKRAQVKALLLVSVITMTFNVLINVASALLETPAQFPREAVSVSQNEDSQSAAQKASAEYSDYQRAVEQSYTESQIDLQEPIQGSYSDTLEKMQGIFSVLYAERSDPYANAMAGHCASAIKQLKSVRNNYQSYAIDAWWNICRISYSNVYGY